MMGAPMEQKTISISPQGQVTIPQRFYELLGFGNEAECILQHDGILLRPVQHHDSVFAEQILADLSAQGYSGDELLARFKAINRQIRPAVEKLIAEADEIAQSGTSMPLEELFAEDE